ncbi:hypothetical protein BKA61DRAFT_41039 [Leptodontidium sp. MPI-SDFR-AT-0119]|nr:hypothetical protein BKA61DRAFT_41039 [Leptodontidium sp. MPI-SDFR-AT-0119]
MELTPIKIPGKYKRNKTKSAVAARKALNRKPGRPPKPLQNAPSIPTTQNSTQPLKDPKKRTLKTIKSKRKMSLLEKLPTELLERVFQFCLNLDLPKASPVISGKLSSSTVFNWTVMRIFGPSWERGYAREKVVGGKDHDDRGERGEEVEEGEQNGEMQSAVLRCRWASLEVLLRAKEVWIQKYAGDRPFKPLYFLKEKNITSTPQPSDYPEPDPDPSNDIDNNSETIDTLPPPQPSTPRLTPSEYHTADFTAFQFFTSEPDGPWPWHTITWSSYNEFSPTLEIPHSLLSSPFAPNTLAYLFHLLKSGARISWLSSTSGEVALSGLQSAITQGNVQAIHLLVWSGLIERLDVEMLIWTLRNAGDGGQGEGVEGRVRTVNQILRLGFMVLEGRERGRVEAELLDIRDEALMVEDEEGLEFVRRVVESETLRERVNVRV